jgi:hypothetical protein
LASFFAKTQAHSQVRQQIHGRSVSINLKILKKERKNDFEIIMAGNYDRCARAGCMGGSCPIKQTQHSASKF